ncbi:hypothetical protein BDV95DRAFT_621399 [Massariosphaeria phaeospora]|uniref:Rhodopsin domain-containing protein n=1 Tax=Massariosphaeria phaeospora TaxID=100035 RepID=A0A7C8M4B8_9PLEO|nr:hypothetical protein BDV95DRAFT_621399 [Massariosphaeria phaeospora]
MSKGGIGPAAVQAFLKGPSSKAPPGVVQNLDNPSNRNGQALAVAIVCIALSAGATIARLYSRLFITKKLRIEDYLGLGAFLPFIGVAWCFFDYRQNVGFFVHQWDLRGRVLIDTGVISFVIGITYSLVMLMLKSAILLEWIRIFVLNRTNNTFFWVSTILVIVNIGVYFAAIITTIAACRPTERVWKFWITGKCIDRKTRDVTNAVFNLIIDIFILLLPQRIVWRLHMSGRRKFGISVVFSVGLLVVATATGRLYSTVTLDYPSDLTKPFDTTYGFSQTLLWAFAEIACIFLVFCVPALPKLFAEHGIVSQIAASWRSWTRLGPRESSKDDSHNVQWPRTIGSAPSTPRRVPHTFGLTDLEGGTQNSLTELADMRNNYIEQAGGKHNPPSDFDIVKTVDIDHHDDAASKTSATPIIDLQHPWAKH